MRILVQRVREASVSVDGRVVAAISRGLLALVGFGRDDGPNFHQSPAFAGMVRKLLDRSSSAGEGKPASTGERYSGRPSRPPGRTGADAPSSSRAGEKDGVFIPS